MMPMAIGKDSCAWSWAAEPARNMEASVTSGISKYLIRPPKSRLEPQSYPLPVSRRLAAALLPSTKSTWRSAFHKGSSPTGRMSHLTYTRQANVVILPIGQFIEVEFTKAAAAALFGRSAERRVGEE